MTGTNQRAADEAAGGRRVRRRPRPVLTLASCSARCRRCHYALMLDSYARGCSHNCAYCYARASLDGMGYWQEQAPLPTRVESLRRLFHTVFETRRPTRWRAVLGQRIPLRLGYASDAFMAAEAQAGVTRELLAVLRDYRYPHIVTTKSDLVAHDAWLRLLDPELCAVQMTLLTTDETLCGRLEPGAPPPRRRLAALRKLRDAGLWTTVRLTPLFPERPDGHFSGGAARDGGEPLGVFRADMLETMAAHGVPGVLAGFGGLTDGAIARCSEALGRDLRAMYTRTGQPPRWDYGAAEKRHYYERLKAACDALGMAFSTCYLGGDESEFERHRDLWSNPDDCCNIRGRVPAFITSAASIPEGERVKHLVFALLDAILTRSYV